MLFATVEEAFTWLFFALPVFAWYSLFICIVIGLLWLVFQTLLSIRKPTNKNGFMRRKFVLVAWLLVIAALASLILNVFYQDKKSSNFTKNLAIDYAKAYKYPVVLPTKIPYNITFDDKWGQIEITQAQGATDEFKITQAPITELGKKYFDPVQGYCDFASMRENYERLIRNDEMCKALGKSGEFTLYKSSTGNNYAIYKNVALKFEGRPFNFENDFKVTDSQELAEVMASEKFNGEYIEVIDRWRREGRF